MSLVFSHRLGDGQGGRQRAAPAAPVDLKDPLAADRADKGGQLPLQRVCRLDLQPAGHEPALRAADVEGDEWGLTREEWEALPGLGDTNLTVFLGSRTEAPRGYIRQMFGPGVDNAIEKYLVPSRELLAVLQLWRASQQIIFRYDVIPGPKVFETQIHGRKFEMYNDTVLGFNKSGKEAVRQQVEEPIYIRPAERVNWL